MAFLLERRFSMTGTNDTQDQTEKMSQAPEDNLNAKIGVLTRREVEARILAPMLDAMGEAFGRERVVQVMRDTIENKALNWPGTWAVSPFNILQSL